jgi:hypothetical protein
VDGDSMQISTQRKREEMRRDKKEDRNNHAQRLKGVYSQREEIKGKFKRGYSFLLSVSTSIAGRVRATM